MTIFSKMTSFYSGDHHHHHRPTKEQMEIEVKKRIEEGKASFHSTSWTTSTDFGYSEFRTALDIQKEIYYEEKKQEEHPVMISTLIWISKALHKQNYHDESMKYLTMALKIQLQTVGCYQRATTTILDLMVDVLVDKGTPQSMADAQILMNTSMRINRRLFGKNHTDSALSTTSAMESSIDVEMTGDLLLLESHEAGIAKYKEAALMEYKEMGSHNMNFALLYRKIALQSLDLNGEKDIIRGRFDDPFDTRLPKTCRSIACNAIKKGDDLLLMTNYEHAAGQYMKAHSKSSEVFFCVE